MQRKTRCRVLDEKNGMRGYPTGGENKFKETLSDEYEKTMQRKFTNKILSVHCAYFNYLLEDAIEPTK